MRPSIEGSSLMHLVSWITELVEAAPIPILTAIVVFHVVFWFSFVVTFIAINSNKPYSILSTVDELTKFLLVNEQEEDGINIEKRL